VRFPFLNYSREGDGGGKIDQGGEGYGDCEGYVYGDGGEGDS
jgi:hypothetical protein